SGGDGRLVAAHEIGRPVSVHAEAVPQPVREELSVAGVLDHLSRGAVDVLTGDAGGERLDASALGAIDGRVDLPELVRGRPEADRASDVRRIPAHLATRIDQHDVADREPPVARPAMRESRGGSELYEPAARDTELVELLLE